MARYPLVVDDQRQLGADYDGVVFVWDIDKTYLKTHFSSLKGLSRIPVEFAVDKRAIAGMPEVLRGLRRGGGPGYSCAPLYFVSASPPQLRSVLERKMLLDGVEHDGIIYKDWLRAVAGLRPGRLREQFGFKLCALLTGRERRPLARELLFGDDVEADAEAFDLYARLVAKEIPSTEADAVLDGAGVAADDRACIRDLLARLPAERGTVERIFIHLERNTAPAAFERYGRRVAPVAGGAQLALALYALGHVRFEDVEQAIAAVRADQPDLDIGALVEDSVERGLIDQQQAAEIDC